MHPVFLTIGNIRSDIRTQATSHAWRCVALIPSPNIQARAEFKTILLSRLFHWSLDLVTASLKKATVNGCMLTDAIGHIRKCYTPLISYIADLPEQQLISCMSNNASPITVAELPQFGNPTPAEPRTRDAILQQIRDLCAVVHPWDLANFQKAAKRVKLLGVHKPFWHDWKFAEPSLFLTGEILTTLHKFCLDYVLEWCRIVAGSNTLDSRFMNLHQRVSFRHFASGVSQQPPMSGQDYRDLERQLVAILDGAGAASDDFIYAIRAMVEFIYRAQDPVHTDSSVAEMEQALADFHSRKQSIINIGARTGTNGTIHHFNIPKMERMASFARQTKANGALIQYTADISERLLITHCKMAFQNTLHSCRTGTDVDQIVDVLNREETIRLFDLYLAWRMTNHSESVVKTMISTEDEETTIDPTLESEMDYTEDEEMTTIDPTLEFLQRVLPDKVSTFRGPRPFRNHFQNPNSLISTGGEIALHVTIHPDHSKISIARMQTVYHLPDLPSVISRYIDEASQDHQVCVWDAKGKVSTWNKFCVQLHSSGRGRSVDKTQIVQAYPPSREYPLGNCDAVLLRRGGREFYSTILVHVIPFPKFMYFQMLRKFVQSSHRKARTRSLPISLLLLFVMCATFGSFRPLPVVPVLDFIRSSA